MPVWRNPAAWFGLAALAIPIAVHLLARVRAHVVAFPSLRFIDISRLAARNRRTLSDLPLLALRLLAVTLAVAACADPLFLTAARRAAWGSRVSRAVVIDTSPSMTRGQADADANANASTDAARAADRESHDTLRATVIRSPSVQDGVARAVAWLRTSPPSRREVVVISDFQVGVVSAAVLRDVPDDMGLRFVRVGQTAREQNADARAVSTRSGGASGVGGTSGAGGFEWRRAQIHLTEETTAVVKRTPIALPPIAITPTDSGLAVAPFGLRVSVAAAERPAALAALHAVLAEGVPAPAQTDRTVEVALTATPRASGARANNDATTAFAPGTLAPVAAPWMATALQSIATDRALTDAIAAGLDLGTLGTSANAESVTGGNTVAPGQRPAGTAARVGPSADAAAASASPWRVVVADNKGTPVLLAATRLRARQAGQAGQAGQTGQTSTPELLLLARVPAAAPATPLLFRAVLRALAGADGVSEAEVRTIPDGALTAWTRPAPEPTTEALRNVEDSDRRWLWTAVLAVLLVETWVRRDRQRVRPDRVEVHERAA